MADEQAVRQYLTAIKHPESLKDDKRLKELDEQIEGAEDVLEEARLMAEQRRLANVQPSDYEQGFVDNAKAWADANEVPAETLEAMGVSRMVLSKAGFEVSVPKSSPAKKKASKPIRREVVIDAINSRTEPFRLAEIEEQTEASLATIRKVVADLVKDGKVKNLKDDPNHTGKGRPPTLYQTTQA